MPMEPFPVGTKVFFLERGKPHVGTVTSTETIEGLRYVVIRLDDGSPKPVKLPVNAVSKAG